jgi:hypothetical protein
MMSVDPGMLELNGPQARALALATRHVNASTPVAIPEAVLLRALRTGIIPPGYKHHVFAVLDETDTATLADLVISGAVTFEQLAGLADQLLPFAHPSRVWLNGRR